MAHWLVALLESIGLRFSEDYAGSEGSVGFSEGYAEDSLDSNAEEKEYTDAEESLLSEGYRYLDMVRSIPILVVRARRSSAHSSGGPSSGGSSSSISSMASGFCPHVTDSCLAGLECEAPALRELACRMVTDGFTPALIGAFAREEGVLQRWFSELDVNEALGISVQDESNDVSLQLPDADDLLLRCSLSSWTRGLTLMSEALSATQGHLHSVRVSGAVASSKYEVDVLQLVRFAEASISKMLGFADVVAAVELAHRSPTESLWVLLNLHAHVSNAYDILMPSLMEECRSTDSREMRGLVSKMHDDFSWRRDKLGEAIWGTVQEFRAIISSRDSWDTIPDDGEVHETTELTLEYLTILWANNSIINSIVLCNSESWHQTSAADMVAGIIRDLEQQLEEESKTLLNPSLRYIFLLNNCDYIEQRLDQLFHFFASGDVFGKDHKLESYLKSYLDISWEPVLSCLRNGSTATWFQIQKQRFTLEKFQSMLEITCSAQKLWKVPNPTLRQRLREAITKKVVGAYYNYLEEHSGQQRGYDGDLGSGSSRDMEDMLNELFEG